MGYWCSICDRLVNANDTKDLLKHYRYRHGIYGKYRNPPIACRQNGCKRTFGLINSLMTHIRSEHRNGHEFNGNDGEPGGVEAPGQMGQPQPEPENEQNEDSDDEAEVIEVPDIDIQVLAGDMMLELLASSSMTQTALQKMISGCSGMFLAFTEQMRREIERIDMSELDSQRLNSVLDGFERPFDELETAKQQIKFFIKHKNLVTPIEIVLGDRRDTTFRTGEQEEVVKMNTFQYISVRSTLQSLYQKPRFREEIRRRNVSTKLLSDYRDGLQARQNEVLRNWPDALLLQIYFDEIEIANPIGSKKTIHKLGMFYYSIENLPKMYNSSMGSVHLLACVTCLDLKEYGYDPIWQPFLVEMGQLMSDEGMDLDGIGRVHGAISTISGDTLAMHDIFGMMGPSANKLCRLCYADRNSIQTKFTEDQFEMRSIDNHQRDVEAAQQRNDPDTGVKRACSLNELRDFHSVTNYNFDPMHDLLEGICGLELKLLLHYIVYELKAMNLRELNQRLRSFIYEYGDRKNRPTLPLPEAAIRGAREPGNSERGLGQKAAQMWCLVRAIPLALGDAVPQDDENWELFILLRRIMDIVFAPHVSMTEIGYLRLLIVDHHNLFKKLYPDVRMVNKHHHLVHYPTCFVMSGPMARMLCLKYELKHNLGKRFSHIMCNFRNPPKTLSMKYQLYNCFQWAGSMLSQKYQSPKGELVDVSEIPHHQKIEEKFSLARDSQVYLAEKVILLGTEYRPDFYLPVAMEGEERLPTFGRIDAIICIGESSSSVYFLTSLCETLDMDTHYYAFAINPPTRDSEVRILTIEECVDFLPLGKQFSYKDGQIQIYLAPRYRLRKFE